MKDFLTFANLKYLVLSVILVVLGINFVKTTREVINNSRRLDDVKNEVDVLKARQNNLNLDLEYMKTDEYLEQQARDALNLIKPNEKVYVSPIDLNINPDTGTQSQKQIDRLKTEPASKAQDGPKPHYLQWLELFL